MQMDKFGKKNNLVETIDYNNGLDRQEVTCYLYYYQ